MNKIPDDLEPIYEIDLYPQAMRLKYNKAVIVINYLLSREREREDK